MPRQKNRMAAGAALGAPSRPPPQLRPPKARDNSPTPSVNGRNTSPASVGEKPAAVDQIEGQQKEHDRKPGVDQDRRDVEAEK